MKRIVLAYSGGLVTSAAIPWLVQQHQSEVVTVTLDLGQERELAEVRERALALGAVRAHVVDAREAFVRDYLLPAMQAGALKTGFALAPPLIAARLVAIARMEKAAVVAHGGHPGAPSEAALHAELQSLGAGLEVLAPARAWRMSRAELVDLARTHGVHIPADPAYRVDASLWGRLVTSGPGHSTEGAPLTLTRGVEECPEHPAVIDIEFLAGVPVRANGVEMPIIELIESLETIAGAHGVGRWPTGEAVVEAPAVAVLDAAHRELERLVVGNHVSALKGNLSDRYAEAVSGGQWSSDLRAAIDGFCQVLQPRVTGTVRLELLKGRCTVISRESANAAGASLPHQRSSQEVA
jgi:argininosuccinate synthase